jgi:hypothetical protein
MSARVIVAKATSAAGFGVVIDKGMLPSIVRLAPVPIVRIVAVVCPAVISVGSAAVCTVRIYGNDVTLSSSIVYPNFGISVTSYW